MLILLLKEGSLDAQSKFEGYAVLELMGHNQEIGYVVTEYFGGPALFRVDSPEFPEREYEITRPQWVNSTFCPAGSKLQRAALPGKTVYVGPSAVFRLTPCSEEVARQALEEHTPRPIRILHIAPDTRQLSGAIDAAIIGDDDQGDDDQGEGLEQDGQI